MATPYELLHSAVGEAVTAGFSESGLAGIVEKEGGTGLVNGLIGYATALLLGFVHRDAMYEHYQTERARMAALAGDSFFDAVLRNIQVGDLALFQGGLFSAGVSKAFRTAEAANAYSTVSALLRDNGDELFSFLSRRTSNVADGLRVVAHHLNLPEPRNSSVLLPKVERQFSRVEILLSRN